MSTPNSLIDPFSDDSNILQYSFLRCNLNITEKNGPVLNNYELIVPSKQSVRFFALLGERDRGRKDMYIFAKQELIKKKYNYYCS
jgi:hypothetical protein